ncbi:MAG: trypsin-like peptidase domain-containing protein [Thermacetogeniaceae bacterium]|jgi:Do/DeqQ family serine protease
MNMRSRRWLVGIVLAAFFAGIAFSGGVLFASVHNRLMNPVLAELNPSQASQSDTTSGSATLGLGPDTIADMVASAGPAVVRIDTTATIQVDNPFFNDPFFRQFFGQDLNQPETQTQQALGSGFLISADGYLLTNQHMIDGAQTIKVTMMGQSQSVDAQVVGSDKDLDLAVLKINAGNNLPYLKLGDSDKIRLGDWAIAIGNPYGLDHTVTVGVISAKGRSMTIESRSYRNLLQTDASINPGNSGGPLLDLAGEVIGINTAVNEQAQGIGFAIPSNTVEDVLNELMKGEHIAHPWLGVEIQDVTQDVATAYGYSGTSGVVVRSVVSGGPADSAGLQEGDIITGWNGAAVADTNDLLQKVQQAGVGAKISLTIWRDKQSITANVTLADRPDSTS